MMRMDHLLLILILLLLVRTLEAVIRNEYVISHSLLLVHVIIFPQIRILLYLSRVHGHLLGVHGDHVLFITVQRHIRVIDFERRRVVVVVVLIRVHINLAAQIGVHHAFFIHSGP